MNHRYFTKGLLVVSLTIIALFYSGGNYFLEYLSVPTTSAKLNLTYSVSSNGLTDEIATTAYQSSSTTTVLTNTMLFLPTIYFDFCDATYTFSELLRYNISAIQANETWDCHKGQGIVVAVIDTGVDLDHPDLVANIVSGQTFVGGTSTPDDDQGHGTHVAGIVAASGNNGGIIGVAPEAKIMPIKVLDSSGSGTTLSVAQGIVWAVDNGAHVINLSLGSVSNSAFVEDAVNYAYNKGVIVITAAGNCGDAFYFFNGCTFQDQPSYPAALDKAIGVAATDSSNNQASYSNEGDYVEISAPGSSIVSTYPGGSYASLDGTSQASPHVAGVAALLLSRTPEQTPLQIKVQLQNTALDLGTSGWDRQTGYGLVQAADALELTSASHIITHPTPVVTLNSTPTSISSESYVSGEIIIKLKPQGDINQVINSLGLENSNMLKVQQTNQSDVQKLVVPDGKELEFVEQLQDSEDILYVEPNYIFTIQ